MTYPNNRLIVEGDDLTEKFGLILLDGYTLDPPEVKTNLIDIPGGNGSLDLSEALTGDILYGNRPQSFSFAVIDPNSFERTKTQVSNYLHGKKKHYQMTMDPGYTYYGRFSVSKYSHTRYANGLVGTIEISITAEPFKMAPDVITRVSAIGGKVVYLYGGRKRVVPTIETSVKTRVIKDGKLVDLPAGTWKVNDLYIREGTNEVYVNSYIIHNLTWGNLLDNQVTCGDFTKRRLFDWYKSNGEGTYVLDTWETELPKTWSEMASGTWGSLMYMSDVTKDIKDIYIKYEVGEL